MKRVITIVLMILAVLIVSAQDDMYFNKASDTSQPDTTAIKIYLTDAGAYEKKEVVQAEGTSTSLLFSRAMEFLSDWTGPDGNAKIGIDYSDKDTGTIIYKGRFSLGFKNVFLGDGWQRYANFTMKIRCKDGRAQVTVTVPTVTAIYNKNNMKIENTVHKLYNAILESKGKKRERGDVLMSDLLTTVDSIIDAIRIRLCETVEENF